MSPMIKTILLALAASTTAYQLDTNAPDGVYEFSGDSNVARAVTPTLIESAKFAEIRKRVPADGVYCEKDAVVLAPNDVNQAKIALGAACDKDQPANKFVSGHGARAAKFGQAVVYVCNHSGNTQGCTTAELDRDIGDVLRGCNNAGGYYSRNKSWKKTYGYNDVARGFCSKD